MGRWCSNLVGRWQSYWDGWLLSDERKVGKKEVGLKFGLYIDSRKKRKLIKYLETGEKIQVRFVDYSEDW